MVCRCVFIILSNTTSLIVFLSKEKLGKTREEKKNGQKDFRCATVNMSSEVINMCVVLVMVRHKLSNRVVKTYAMLDTCSQETFAKENLLSNLGIQGINGWRNHQWRSH